MPTRTGGGGAAVGCALLGKRPPRPLARAREPDRLEPDQHPEDRRHPCERCKSRHLDGDRDEREEHDGAHEPVVVHRVDVPVAVGDVR